MPKKNKTLEVVPNEPIPIETDVPAGEVNITVIQAAIDDRFKKNEKDLKDTSDLMRIGFFVLLIMVATIIIIVLLDYKNSVGEYNDGVTRLQNDRYQFLEKRMEYLEKISTTSAKR